MDPIQLGGGTLEPPQGPPWVPWRTSALHCLHGFQWLLGAAARLTVAPLLAVEGVVVHTAGSLHLVHHLGCLVRQHLDREQVFQSEFWLLWLASTHFDAISAIVGAKVQPQIWFIILSLSGPNSNGCVSCGSSRLETACLRRASHVPPLRSCIQPIRTHRAW